MSMDSILTSVKKDLGITENDTSFDPEIIMDINTCFSVLTQLGVGPADGFSISDSSAVWTDFIPDTPKLNGIKTYVCKKTRLMFDQTSSSYVLDELNKICSEMEWRMSVAAESE